MEPIKLDLVKIRSYQTLIENVQEVCKPCPFCGVESIDVHSSPDYSFFWLECRDCIAKGPESTNLRIAASGWNRRYNNG